MNIIEYALKYLGLGMSVIPVAQDKKPLIKWEPYQSTHADHDTINKWHNKWPNMNIGVVTGDISDLLVVDCDTQEAIKQVDDLIPESMLVPCQSTPSGGKHFFFKHQDGFTNKARVRAGIDIRTTGGFVVISPSVNGGGKKWQWIDGSSILDVALSKMPKELARFLIDNKDNINNKENNLYIRGVDKSEETMPEVSTSVYKMFQEGSRDDDLFSVANALVRSRMSNDKIHQVIQILANNCNPPFPSSETEAKIVSAIRRAERRERNLSEEVRDWLCLQTGYIMSTDCLHDLQLSTREDKKNLSIIFKRLCDQGIIEKYGEKSGCFRKIDNEIELIDWENADDTIVPIQWPFEIEQYVSIMPKNIIVIAGVPNSGKTAILLNFARMNMDKFPMIYFSSEMEGAELKSRLKKFDGPMKQWRKIGFYKKEEDFASSLIPDGINIVDFLEITDKFYLVAERMREYHKRLNRGIMVVAIQKDPQKEYGRGGGLGLEKPRLYMTLDKGKLRIVKGKMWASEVNPEGMYIEFKIVQGCKLIPQGYWKKPDYKIDKQDRYAKDN